MYKDISYRWDEPFQLPALWSIKVHNLKTGKVFYIVEKEENLVVLSGRNWIRDFLYGDAVTGLTHMGVGTSTVAPSTDPDIGEVFRKTFTDKVKANGQLTIDMFLSSGEANGNTLSAVGLFGNGATDTIGSGTQYNKLIHTGAQAIEKTSSIAVTYTCDLYFTAV